MLNLIYSENGLYTGRLSILKDSIFGDLRTKASSVSIIPDFSRDRLAVEEFITDIYARSYGASIHVEYPVLMSVCDQDGEILAATGFRSASEEPLFLEQYLDKSVQEILQVSRDQIVEIGNLASDGGGASLYLFVALAAYLNDKGYTQVVVTSTNFLERRFQKIGFQPKRIARADPGLLLSERENWGSYYKTQPHVISLSVAQGYQCLQRLFGVQYTDYRLHLFPRVHYKKG